MYEVEANGPNRVDLTFSGRLDADAMRSLLEELLALSEGVEHGRMLYRVGDFKLPTFKAMGVELARLPKLFRLVRHFDRVAVVAEEDWVQTIGEIEGALIPGLVIKGFDPDEVDEAEAWLVE